MSIFVDETTKVVYQGLTGSQGKFYGLRNRDYGTQVVAGTNPKKAGTDVEGIPIFANVGEAVAATGANASCIFIPAPGVRAAVEEAAEAGIEFIVVITEGVPAHDEATFYNWKKKYGGMELQEIKRLRQLEEENSKLKRMFANLSLEHEALKDLVAKKF